MRLTISDFIQSPDRCTAAEINRACMALADGDTLDLEGKTLYIDAEGATVKHYFVSNNDSGDKPLAFHLCGKKNITIDGGGAALVFCGLVTPFIIDGCEHVTVKDLSVDYRDMFCAQATILEAEEDRLVLSFDEAGCACSVDADGALLFRARHDGWEYHSKKTLVMEYESKTGIPRAPIYFCCTGEELDPTLAFLSYMNKQMKATELAEGVIELRGNTGARHTVGNKWVTGCAERECPGFVITEAKDILLQGVTLYHTESMGVLAQMTENITLDGVTVDTQNGSGRYMSAKADATHFVNCRGDIVIKHCKFVKMPDDAGNIHGIYIRDMRRVDAHTLTAVSAVNIFRAGDRMRILDINTVQTVAELTVSRSQKAEGDGERITVSVEEALPELKAEYIAENLSTAPRVHLAHTECGHNRPRGFLLSSAGEILVEGCRFYNMGAGVNVGGEMLDWYESGGTTDVTVRHNVFDNAAYRGGPAINVIAKINNREEAGPFHKKIRIENNVFRMHEKRFLEASNVEDIAFVGNAYIEDESLPSFPVKHETGVYLAGCVHTNIEEI